MASLGDLDVVEAEDEDMQEVMNAPQNVQAVNGIVRDDNQDSQSKYILDQYISTLKKRFDAMKQHKKDKIKVLKPIQEESSEEPTLDINLYKKTFKKVYNALKINEIGPKSKTSFLRSPNLLKK